MKLAICIPAYGDTKAKFTQSLASMLVHTAQADLRDKDGERIRVQIETFIVSSSMLTESRHRLVAEALAWGADYMLWCDADHVFPHDAFCRLWGHGLPVVGVNYPRRSAPTGPTAAYLDGEGPAKVLYTTQEKAEAGEVEACAHMGFGLCLIDMRVYDLLQTQAEAEGEESMLPLFKFEPTPNKVGMIGEDVFFFKKIRDAGITPYIDHGLSWEVGHSFEVLLTNAHAVAQSEKWEAHRKTRADKFAQKAAQLEFAAEGEVVA